MSILKKINIGKEGVNPVTIGGSDLVFIGGPCAIESEEHSLSMCQRIKDVCKSLDIEFIFKSCFDKDCRSSPDSYHGIGMDEGLDILSKVRNEFNVPVVTDFSEPEIAPSVGEVVDLIQVPAYLCRQTSILRAAAKTGVPVHLKKGQFMSPWNMKNSVRKLESFGASEILLTDRGTFFGYGQLVNDLTSLPIMAKLGYPVCFDATHSIQMPTSMGSVSGGQREFIPYLARAAAGAGINALFMEVHDNPADALSDPNTVLDLKHLKFVLENVKAVHETTQNLLKKFNYAEIHVE